MPGRVRFVQLTGLVLVDGIVWPASSMNGLSPARRDRGHGLFQYEDEPASLPGWYKVASRYARPRPSRGRIIAVAYRAMLQLVWPWMLAAVVAPFVVARVVPRAPDAPGAPVRIPYFEEALAWSGRPAGSGPRLRQVIALLAWCALVLAAARPQWVGDPVPLPVRGRDLMLALDLSGSMREQDMKSRVGFEARIDAVKRVAGDFAARRTGDRIGLVLFGSRAYLQAPLTLDLDTVSEMISEAVLGLAGEQTAIGDAIGLAVKRLRGRPAENRVLVLLTDGADTASEVDPLAAARFAADEGITIYAVGVGADEAAANRWFGALRARSRTALDESALRAIAGTTGGRYFRARDTADLEEIYRLIDMLEPVGGDDEMFRPTRELFHWPLGVSVALFAFAASIGAWDRVPSLPFGRRPGEGSGG